MNNLQECKTLGEIAEWLDNGGVTYGDGHPAENIMAALTHAHNLAIEQAVEASKNADIPPLGHWTVDIVVRAIEALKLTNGGN